MTAYTIGALFSEDFSEILLIKKKRPGWQAGKYNLPGGHCEEGETGYECVSREFDEETGVASMPEEWTEIGRIEGTDYYVLFYTMVHNVELHGSIDHDLSDEPIAWFKINELPENIMSNLRWLIPFAFNTHKQGNKDNLIYGNFMYQNK